MRDVTAWFVLLGPPLVLLVDWLVYFRCGYPATITAVVREWHSQSVIPEVLFVAGIIILWLHLFHDFPDQSWWPKSE